MIRFQIIGETPSKKNSKVFAKVKGHLIPIPSKAHQKWHDDAMLQITGQLSRMEREELSFGAGHPDGIDYSVAVTLTFYHGTMVRRDSDNQAASIMDLLQDAKVLSDDRWQIVRILNIYNHYDKGNSRCLIEINRL